MELSSIGVSKDRGDMNERRSAGDENELFGAFFDVAKRFELELVQRGGDTYRISGTGVARDRSSGRGGRSG